MAVTYYEVHKETDINPIKVGVPDKKKITVKTDLDANTLTFTIPSGTFMGLGTAVAESSNWFNFNYVSLITVIFKDAAGKEIARVPKSSTIATMCKSSSNKNDANYYPKLADFKEFSNNVILFHRGISGGTDYNWSESLSANKTIIVDIPSGAVTYDSYISGSSMNTTTFRRYIWDPAVNGETITGWSHPSWASVPSGLSHLGGNACNHSHTEAVFNDSNKLWEELSGGSITSIVDNGDNTITITGIRATAGAGNSIKSSTLSYDFGSGTDPAPENLGTASNTNFTYTISIPSNVTSSTVTLKVTLNAKPTQAEGIEITREKSADPAINRYTFPTPPTKIWINTGKASQYTDNVKSSLSAINGGKDPLEANNDCKPRNKEILMWKWSGATHGGGAAVIDGFRVYIHRVAKGTTGSPVTETPGNTINLSGKTLYEIENEGKSNEALDTYTNTETSKGHTDTYGYYCDIPYDKDESNDAQFGFIPVDLGFNAGDLCYCEVFTYNTWGDDKRRYSKNSATDTKYVPIIGACNIFNGAVVWVNVDTDDDGVPDTWKEGIVYVYDGTTWQEAEGVYVLGESGWQEAN